MQAKHPALKTSRSAGSASTPDLEIFTYGYLLLGRAVSPKLPFRLFCTTYYLAVKARRIHSVGAIVG